MSSISYFYGLEIEVFRALKTKKKEITFKKAIEKSKWNSKKLSSNPEDIRKNKNRNKKWNKKTTKKMAIITLRYQ